MGAFSGTVCFFPWQLGAFWDHPKFFSRLQIQQNWTKAFLYIVPTPKKHQCYDQIHLLSMNDKFWKCNRGFCCQTLMPTFFDFSIMIQFVGGYSAQSNHRSTLFFCANPFLTIYTTLFLCAFFFLLEILLAWPATKILVLVFLLLLRTLT